MSYKGPEKICKGPGSGGRKIKKWLKKVTNRYRRRKAKRDPENAPTKNRYFGWTT
jgi:hypothetical protein